MWCCEMFGYRLVLPSHGFFQLLTGWLTMLQVACRVVGQVLWVGFHRCFFWIFESPELCQHLPTLNRCAPAAKPCARLLESTSSQQP